jgi:membrane protease YdiL (CAAX protease family)
MSSPAPEQAVRPSPTFGTAVRLVIILWGITIGLSPQLALHAALINGILKAQHFAKLSFFFFQFPLQVSSFGLTIWIAQRWSRRPWRELLALRSVTNRIWLPLLVALPGLLSVTITADILVNRLLPEPAWFSRMFEDAGIVAIVLVAPLTEEPLFRGVILGGFLDRYGQWPAILLSALLFSLSHLNPWQLLPTFIGGIMTG